MNIKLNIEYKITKRAVVEGESILVFSLLIFSLFPFILLYIFLSAYSSARLASYD